MKASIVLSLLFAGMTAVSMASGSGSEGSSPSERSRVETLTLSDGNRLQVVYVDERLVTIIHDKEGFFTRKSDEPEIVDKAPALKTWPGHHPARVTRFDFAEYTGSDGELAPAESMWQLRDDADNIMGYIICGDKGCGYNGYPPEGS